jgi:hypothetical protein
MRMARMFACVGAVGLLILASCADPVAPAGQGVVSIHVGLQAGTTCTPGPHWANVPFSASAGQRVSATEAGDATNRAVDGEAEMKVKCSVVPAGGKFKINADLSSPAPGSSSTATNIIFTTTIGPGEEGAPGTLSLLDDKTATFFGSSTCTFSVKPANGSEHLAIDAGKVWGSVTCTSFRDPGDPGAACSIDKGFFVLENCGQ